MGSDGLDDMLDLDGAGDDATSPPGKSDAISQEARALDSILTEEYCEEVPPVGLPPIDEHLSKILTKWLRVLPSKEKTKELFKQCLLPENVPGLKPVRINDLLYEKLSFNYKINDQKLRGINTFLARGLGPLISVWDRILKFESLLISNEKAAESLLEINHQGSLLKLGTSELDITALRRDLDKGVRLLSACHSSVLFKRRNQLKSFFDPKFHYLLRATNPITTELLGDNVDLKIQESTKLSEAAQKLQLRRSSHFGEEKFNRQLAYRKQGGRRSFSSRSRQYDRRRPMAAPYRGSPHTGRGHYASRWGNYIRGRHNITRSNSGRYPRRF